MTGKKGATLTVDKTFGEVSTDQFDMLVIPGGGAPENLRIVDEAVDFTQQFVESGKPVGAICHGPQLLISAKVLKGRTVDQRQQDPRRCDRMRAASTPTMPWSIDGNLITSRVPGDLPVFNDALGRALAPAAVS